MRRIVLLVVAAAVVAAGLGLHTYAPSTYATDAAGDVLYAVLMYLLAAFAWPRREPPARYGPALAALLWCVGVELLQLTGRPAAWGSPWTLVFGSGFAWADLLWYAAGVALAAYADRAATMSRS